MNAMDLSHIVSLRSALWASGFRPVALYSGDKRPFGTAWQARARLDPPEAVGAAPRMDATNTGVLCDGLRAVDIDVDDPDLAVRIEAEAAARFGATITRWRDNSGRRLLLYRAAEGMPVKRVLAGTLGRKVEVLGLGQQLHSHGRHPSGAALHWRPEPPEVTPLHALPAVTEGELDDFLAEVAPMIGAAQQMDRARDKAERPKPEAHASVAEVVAVLAQVPNDGPADWERFNLVGMAIFRALGGAAEGLELFTEWSRRNPAYHGAEVEGRWQHYYKSPPNKAGMVTLLRLARDAVTPEKRPLFRPTPPAPEFPVAALGPLREAAEAIQMRTQAPLAMCANSVLAAAALATQAQRDVELPGGGQKPLTAIFVSVADSGERKTSVDKLALAPVYRMEEAWRGEHDAALHSYNNDKEAWKEAREAVKKRSKGDRAAIREGLNQVGPEPKAPPHPMLLVADPTPEALVLHLRDSRPWAGVFTAEGGILVGGAAFNDESRMRTGALFNTLWDGEPIRRTRVGTGAAFLPGRRCTSHVMLQPVVADKLFGDPMLDGIGMLARTLLVAPDSTAGRRLFRETSIECRATLDAYGSRLEYLLRRLPATKADDASVLDPPVLRLHPDAARLWIQFHDAAEVALLPGGDYATIKAFGAKLGEHAGRLAAVLTVYADPDAIEVPAAMMACGITLAQHYAAEMLRLQGASTVSPDLRLAARLLAWWQARPDPRCHAAAIYQRGPSAVRDNSTARRIVGILEEHGFVRRLPAGTELDDGPRRDAWELLP